MNEEYKTICNVCNKKTWYETEQTCHARYQKQNTCITCNHSEIVEPIEYIPCTGTLKLFDTSDLDLKLTPYYTSKERVEVKTKYKTTERFYVGKSSGWKPVYIKIKKLNSLGGEAIYPGEVLTVKGLNKYNR